jgi:hypothetical protein
MLPIFQKKFVQELRDFSAVSGEGCRSERRGEFHLNNSTFRVTLDTSTDASCRDVSQDYRSKNVRSQITLSHQAARHKIIGRR